MSKSTNDIKILDVTIRDGSYAVNYQFTEEQVFAVAQALDRAGVDYIEVGHGCGLCAGEKVGLPPAASDVAQVRSAKAAVKRAKIGVIANPEPGTLPLDIDSVIDHLDFIRFAANCDNPRILEKNIFHARSRRPDIEIFVQLMRSTRVKPEKLVDSMKIAEDMGVNIAYLVDTAGHFLPEQVFDLVSRIRNSCSIGVGFHGHNNMGLANANSLAAVRAGAVSIDASLKGIGRAAGNAQLEAIVSLLRRAGMALHVDFDQLLRAGEELVAPIMPPSKGIAAIDLTTADLNIDVYPLSIYERISAEANVDLTALIRAIAANLKTVEIELDGIESGLRALGKDPDKVLAAIGIKKR